MKAVIYAVQTNAGWSWKVSLDFRVDIQHWFRQYGAKCRMVELEPSISWGQAIGMKQFLEARYGSLSPQLIIHKARGEMIQYLTVTKASSGLINEIRLKEVFGDDLRLDSFENDEKKIDQSLLNLLCTAMQGRFLLEEELNQLLTQKSFEPLQANWRQYIQTAYLLGRVELWNGISVKEQKKFWQRKSEYRCRRCGSGENRMHRTYCLFCAALCPYCEECLTMGRTRWCSLLIQGLGQTLQEFSLEPIYCDSKVASLADSDALNESQQRWSLSPAQTEAAFAALHFLENSEWKAGVNKEPPCFLIWAVTGAGKTEMIFPLVEREIAKGGSVLIATPRRDVVLELLPRIRKAFPEQAVVALYGGSEQRWERAEITIATTHQLLRFKHAFDLVVIDELDAFPFHNNPMLEYAAKKSVKPAGRFILLSATPPLQLQKAARRGILSHVKVPVRFHRFPLPVPVMIRVQSTSSWLQKRTLPAALLQPLRKSLERGAQLFLFVSQIKSVEPLVLLLRGQFPDKIIQGTSSKDELRSEKVTDFRLAQTDILVTTTILERGVTVPKTDVFIINADSGLFDEAALVQMAGRSGRSKEDPKGNVYFAAQEKTRSQVAAIRQIKRMNALAKAKGYLREFKAENDK